MKRNVKVVSGLNGKKIVQMRDILFAGKKSINWNEVKAYLESYVGNFYEIMDTKDIVYIGKDFPDEYTGSKYTYMLKGANAKANGWYRYDSYFALPVYDAKREVERYNVFHASMLIRHANDGKMYLYDILDIKKETSNPFRSQDLTW